VATAVAPSAAAGQGAALQASGYVTARRQATVSAQITGTIREVLIEEGEHVKAGQVLARLDDAAYQAGVAQARAQLMAAQALEIQYQGQLAQARRETVRSQDLIDRGLASRQSLELAQTAEGTLAAQLQAQRRQVELAQAALHGAEVQLGYCTVRAPFDGVIVAKSAQSGEIISPISAGGGFTRTGVGTIVDMDSLEIEVDVNEAYIHRVVPSQPAQAVLDAYPDWTIPAHVIAIIPTADRNKATVKVRVGLDQKDPRILPDMGVRVSFLERGASGGAVPPAIAGVLVPGSAIAAARGGNIAYVVEDGHARAMPVTAGQAFGDLRAVTGIAATPLVQVENLSKTYVRGAQRVEVLHNIDLAIDTGDFMALMGPSGSGKTTLLNLIGGLDAPSGGRITVGGVRIDELPENALARWRSQNVGFVFQFYNLLSTLSARGNVELPLLLTRLSRSERRQRADIALQLVGLADRAVHKPAELSGGQQQRVAIARAIVSDPTLLVCDEPTGDLDRQSAAEVLTLLQQLNRQHGKTIIMVTHDPKAAEFADHIVHLDKGTLVDVVERPAA
jgi:RND family efflux transporter MFP subunit